MMELLKQWVFSPVSVPKQVCSMYAGSKWYLDNIDTDKILKFEEELYASLDKEKTILKDIKENKIYSDKSEKKLEEIIKKVSDLNK
jgi:F-type H+-transporting ATPase subunit alpha